MQKSHFPKNTVLECNRFSAPVLCIVGYGRGSLWNLSDWSLLGWTKQIFKNHEVYTRVTLSIRNMVNTGWSFNCDGSVL